MDPLSQPQLRRGRRSQAEKDSESNCSLPTTEKKELPAGARYKRLPDGEYMIIKDNFPNRRGDA